VQVLERNSSETELGTGLSLWPNALTALGELGLASRVESVSLAERSAGIRNPSGRWLARTDLEQVLASFGALMMIRRADLLGALANAVPTDSIRRGMDVLEAKPEGEVVDRDGVRKADLIVGADGIRSAVRRSVWPEVPSPRYAGYTAWRLISDLGRTVTEGGETWGRGLRFGLAPLPDGRVYAFAVANAPKGTRGSAGELAELQKRFAGWHQPIAEVLDAAEERSILRSDVEELPRLHTYARGRVALVGDAAHAMTPNLGQGACQALEDAVTLAVMLDRHRDVPAALLAYDAARRPRTQYIAQLSRRIGRVAQWQARPAVALRSTLLALAPRDTQLRSLAPVLAWTPPGPSGSVT
jgi:2-polyprenyl-6-methoxyphenol hydroxylase-like FAD-dependent oxidoreductase